MAKAPQKMKKGGMVHEDVKEDKKLINKALEKAKLAKGGLRGPRGPNKNPKGLAMKKGNDAPSLMPKAPMGPAAGGAPPMGAMKKGGTKMKSGGVVVEKHTKDYCSKRG